MELHFEKKNDTLLVRLKGELDMHTANRLRQGLEDQLQSNPSLKNMIMDLKGIDFIDSSGLGVLLGRYKTVKARGGQFGLTNVAPQVKRIFELSGMLKLMSLHETMEQAERAFNLSGF